MKLWPSSRWSVALEQTIPMFLSGGPCKPFVRFSDIFCIGAEQHDKDQYVRGTFLSPFCDSCGFMMARTTFERCLHPIRDDYSRWFVRKGEHMLSTPPDVIYTSVPEWSADDNDVHIFVDRDRALKAIANRDDTMELELWRSAGSFDQTGVREDIGVFLNNVGLIKQTNAYYWTPEHGYNLRQSSYNDADKEGIIWRIDLPALQQHAIHSIAMEDKGWSGLAPRLFWSDTEYVKWSLSADLDRYKVITPSELTFV